MIEFRVLGAIEVLERGEVVPLSRGKERALLAVLLLRANEVVPVDRLVAELWPDEPPAQAAKTVQVYVSRLRQRLGERAILTRSPGYMIPLDPDQLDLSRFERLVASSRDLSPGEAGDRLREALALFRGPVLADVAYEPFAQNEIARIEELRLEALEARITADLARGRHAGLVPELESLVRGHPLREGLRANLALALYRAGRQADALEVVREGRRKLVDELGLEPAEELKLLERAILSHDPELEPSRLDTADDAVTLPPTRWRSRRASLAAAAAGAVLVGAALVAAVFAWSSDDSPIMASSGSVALIDPGRNAVTAAIQLPERPSRIAVQGDDVWILHPDAATLTRVSRSERSVSRSLGLGGAPGSIAAEEGAVWVSDVLAGTVTRIDAERPDVRRTFAARPGPAGLVHSDAGALTFGFGSLWFASGRRTMTRVDPKKLVSRGSIRDVGTAGPSIGGIATSAGAVWVADLRALTRIDPRSNTVEAVVELAVFRVAGLAGSAEGAWLSDAGSDQVFLVDAARTQVAGVTKVGSQPLGVAYGAGAVWVANSGDGTVSRIDPPTGRVVATITVGGSPTGIAATDDEVWVTVA